MNHKNSEKGQALIIIALMAVVLFGFGALAIDGSMVFSDRRHAQNAADTAAMAGALAYARGADITTAATTRSTSNGYDGSAMNAVTVTITDAPSGACPGNASGKDIKVDIVSNVNMTIARIIGIKQMTNTVTATSRGCSYYSGALFDGNSIVGLDPSTSTCAFDSGNSNAAHWTVTGGGIFSNGCAHAKNTSSVTLDSGQCVTSVATASGFTCTDPNQTSEAISYPADVLAIMPPNPCDGTPGDVGLPPPASGSTFTNGVYCISNMDAYDKKDIVLNNATLYVTDQSFTLKFAGGGGFSGTPSSSGDFQNYYMVIAYNPTPCQQSIQYRGNGSGTFSGTILAPSACIDLRGNGESSGIHTQIIGYDVTSNGNAEVYVNYQANENHQAPVRPTITLLK